MGLREAPVISNSENIHFRSRLSRGQESIKQVYSKRRALKQRHESYEMATEWLMSCRNSDNDTGTVRNRDITSFAIQTEYMDNTGLYTRHSTQQSSEGVIDGKMRWMRCKNGWNSVIHVAKKIAGLPYWDYRLLTKLLQRCKRAQEMCSARAEGRAHMKRWKPSLGRTRFWSVKESWAQVPVCMPFCTGQDFPKWLFLMGNCSATVDQKWKLNASPACINPPWLSRLHDNSATAVYLRKKNGTGGRWDRADFLIYFIICLDFNQLLSWLGTADTSGKSLLITGEGIIIIPSGRWLPPMRPLEGAVQPMSR